jgi:hypothetical protein
MKFEKIDEVTFEEIIKLISSNTKTDYNTVNEVVKFHFKQVKNIMKDEDDIRDILFNNLFKFKLKTRYKDNKHLNYISK